MGRKTKLPENGLIWFGAGISIAEIITGTYFAALDFATALAAVILGHIIGCTLLFLAGAIGGKTGKSAMQTVGMSFGSRGSMIFAVINIVQLTGWTAIMIYDGARAAEGIFGCGHLIWCTITGGLIILWILIGLKNLGRVNIVAMTALFVLTVILCVLIFGSGRTFSASPDGSLSFGAAVELAVAMPLSWLPLISDYTREAEKPVKASAVSAVVYGAVSCWMYIIGMGAASAAGTSDIASVFLRAGLGIAGLVIIIFSTVTTTFLDAWSAGISCESAFPEINGKKAAVIVAAAGTVCACIFPMDNITDFLYFIGSVFAPMIAIQITDYFILRQSSEHTLFCTRNFIIWGTGFAAYRLLMLTDIPVGNTLPDMVLTGLICIIWNRISGKHKKKTAPGSAV